MITFIQKMFSLEVVLMAILILAVVNMIRISAEYVSGINQYRRITGRKFVPELKSHLRL